MLRVYDPVCCNNLSSNETFPSLCGFLSCSMATDVRTVEKLSPNLMFECCNPHTELCQFSCLRASRTFSNEQFCIFTGLICIIRGTTASYLGAGYVIEEKRFHKNDGLTDLKSVGKNRNDITIPLYSFSCLTWYYKKRNFQMGLQKSSSLIIMDRQKNMFHISFTKFKKVQARFKRYLSEDLVLESFYIYLVCWGWVQVSHRLRNEAAP